MQRFATGCGYSSIFLAKGSTEYQVGVLAKPHLKMELVHSFNGPSSAFLRGLLLVRVRVSLPSSTLANLEAERDSLFVYIATGHFTLRSSSAREAECVHGNLWGCRNYRRFMFSNEGSC